MDMNLVISWGLAVMGTLAVVGWIIISIQTGTSSGTEVPISIISGLVGVLTGKNLAQSKLFNGGVPPSVGGEIISHANENLSKASAMVDTALEMLKQKKEEAPHGKS